jgi:hypothetical protein
MWRDFGSNPVCRQELLLEQHKARSACSQIGSDLLSSYSIHLGELNFWDIGYALTFLI